MSATGVSDVRYKRQIELSTELTEREKKAALAALDKMLQEIVEGTLADFRMIIRGQQRTTHSALLATCPERGIALDIFCGTGTTNLVAFHLGRKSIGVDLCHDYIDAAAERCNFLL